MDFVCWENVTGCLVDLYLCGVKQESDCLCHVGNGSGANSDWILAKQDWIRTQKKLESAPLYRFTQNGSLEIYRFTQNGSLPRKVLPMTRSTKRRTTIRDAPSSTSSKSSAKKRTTTAAASTASNVNFEAGRLRQRPHINVCYFEEMTLILSDSLYSRQHFGIATNVCSSADGPTLLHWSIFQTKYSQNFNIETWHHSRITNVLLDSVKA